MRENDPYCGATATAPVFLAGFYRGTPEFGIDVARETDCERLIRETVAKFGTVHLLVNNAGIGGGDWTAKTSTEAFDRVLKTNLYGTFYCARAAYRQVRTNQKNPRGAVINISSVAGKMAWGGAHRRSHSGHAYGPGVEALSGGAGKAAHHLLDHHSVVSGSPQPLHVHALVSADAGTSLPPMVLVPG